jgi:alpha-L-fucosidase
LNNRYKSVGQVVCQLIDIVSKNGNLLLSIPMRGDGTIDSLEVVFLGGMAQWMNVNGDAIFGTRPWKVYGEGPTKVKSGMFNESKTRFTYEDVRFIKKGDLLFAFIMGWPSEKNVLIKTLASNSPLIGGQNISDVSLLGFDGILKWTQDNEGLHITMPKDKPCEHAIALKIKGIIK